MNNEKVPAFFNFRFFYPAAILSLTLLLAIALKGYNYLKKSEATSKMVVHTFIVINELNLLQNTLTEIGADQRGYIITQQDNYLTSFNQKTELIEDKIASLFKLTKNNPRQIKNLKELKIIIRDELDFFIKSIDLVKSDEEKKAILLVKSGKGQELIEKMIRKITEMISIENRLLKERLSKSSEFSYFSSIFVLIGSALAFVIVMGAIFQARFELKRRILAQNKYFKSSQIQNAMLQGAGQAIISTDKDGIINLFNHAAEKLFGISSQKILGTDLLNLVREESTIALVDLSFETLVKELRSRKENEFKFSFIKNNGIETYINLTITELKDKDGRFNGIFCIGFDLSERIAFEKAIIEAKELALAGSKSKSEFLANISHEIRTPMNAIIGMAQLLNKTNLNSDQRKFVEVFQNAGETLLNLINDVLDVSKIEAGHFELQRAPFDPTFVVAKAVDLMALKASQKGIELIINIEDDVPDQLVGDENRIAQILINLLGNAIKFTDRGEVSLRISSSYLSLGSTQLIIEVHDTGIGISSEKQKLLFERFSQADASITKQFGGTGLGLSITKTLVEHMDGTIYVNSTQGVGSKFVVKVNLKSEHSQRSFPQVNLSGLKFLIIEPHEKLLESIQTSLSECDATTIAFKDFSSADLESTFLASIPQEYFLLMNLKDFEAIQNKIIESPTLKAVKIIVMTFPTTRIETRPPNVSYIYKPIIKRRFLMEILSLTKNTNVQNDVINYQSAKSDVRSLEILLVDDNEDNRLVVKAFLKNLPWTLIEAFNGMDALQKFRDKKFDLILMDMQMPVMDGYAATESIRELEYQNGIPHTPIIAFTAYALKEEIERCLSSGCNLHLSKPFKENDLVRSVESLSSPISVNISKGFADIIPKYLSNRSKDIEQLKKAIAEENFDVAQIIGHKLLGSAGSYGFDSLSEVGLKLELFSKQRNLAELRKNLYVYENFLQRLRIIEV